MKRSIFFWMAAVFFLAGCATAPTAIEKQDVAAPAVKAAEETPAASPRLFEERDLLLEGVALLNGPDQSEPSQARSVFISLIQRYPQSRWRPAAALRPAEIALIVALMMAACSIPGGCLMEQFLRGEDVRALEAIPTDHEDSAVLEQRRSLGVARGSHRAR